MVPPVLVKSELLPPHSNNLRNLKKYPYDYQVKFVIRHFLFALSDFLRSSVLLSIPNTIINATLVKSFKHVKRMLCLAAGMPYALASVGFLK